MTATQKDRWAAKSERRAAWAQAAEAKAAAILSAQPVRDWAFMSQPGHIPARARDIAQTDRAFALLAADVVAAMPKCFPDRTHAHEHAKG